MFAFIPRNREPVSVVLQDLQPKCRQFVPATLTRYVTVGTGCYTSVTDGPVIIGQSPGLAVMKKISSSASRETAPTGFKIPLRWVAISRE